MESEDFISFSGTVEVILDEIAEDDLEIVAVEDLIDVAIDVVEGFVIGALEVEELTIGAFEVAIDVVEGFVIGDLEVEEATIGAFEFDVAFDTCDIGDL